MWPIAGFRLGKLGSERGRCEVDYRDAKHLKMLKNTIFLPIAYCSSIADISCPKELEIPSCKTLYYDGKSSEDQQRLSMGRPETNINTMYCTYTQNKEDDSGTSSIRCDRRSSDINS